MADEHSDNSKLYLTIDDSPSSGSDRIIDYLSEHNIPALFFCRGDKLEQNPDPIINAVKKGFKIGNHAYSHRPAGEIGIDAVIAEIEKTEEIISQIYQEAGFDSYDRIFRFPYIDRGDGDRLERRFSEIIEKVKCGKQDFSLHDKNNPKNRNVNIIQEYLREQGYVQPFKNINHPLYEVQEIAEAIDCIFTFSSCDWKLNSRHKGKYGVNDTNDLKKIIELDDCILRENQNGIALFHDHDEIIDVTLCLIGYMRALNVGFISY